MNAIADTDRSEVLALLDVARKAIRSAILAKGRDVASVDFRDSVVIVDAVLIDMQFQIDRPSTFLSNRRSGNGRIVVGTYLVSKKQYPMHKDGSFDIESIVQHIETCVSAAKRRNAAHGDEMARRRSAMAIRNELVGEFYADTRKDSDGNPVLHDERVQVNASKDGIAIEIGRSLTIDQARSILETCRNIGLIAPRTKD